MFILDTYYNIILQIPVYYTYNKRRLDMNAVNVQLQISSEKPGEFWQFISTIYFT